MKKSKFKIGDRLIVTEGRSVKLHNFPIGIEVTVVSYGTGHTIYWCSDGLTEEVMSDDELKLKVVDDVVCEQSDKLRFVITLTILGKDEYVVATVESMGDGLCVIKALRDNDMRVGYEYSFKQNR